MKRRIWALRAGAVATPVGGLLVSNSVWDPSRPAASTVVFLSSVGLGMLLGHRSTKIKA